MSSSQLDDMREDDRYNRLAQILGITYDEVVELDPDIRERSSDDGVPYELYIEFDQDAPRHILEKIKGIDSTGTLYLDPNDFNAPDDEQY